jgi:uncharacterized protein
MVKLGYQRWDDILFLHWDVPVDALVPAVDPRLEIDTFGGRAFVSLAPFTVKNARLRFTPPLPSVRRFDELNLRTYVRHGDKAGVWFFSLDAASPVAVLLARAALGLPYAVAKLRRWRVREERHYKAERRCVAQDATLRVGWVPGRELGPQPAGTLEHFLVERYCLFSRTVGGALLRVDVAHRPWPLREARVLHLDETISKAAQLPGPREGWLAHASEGVDVTFTGLALVERPTFGAPLHRVPRDPVEGVHARRVPRSAGNVQ